MAQMGEFTTLQFKYITDAIADEQGTTLQPLHTIYFKEHKLRKQDQRYPQGRTLFVLNPPVHAENVLSQVFEAAAGAPVEVTLTQMTVGSKKKMTSKTVPVCYIIFSKANHLKAALKFAQKGNVVDLAAPAAYSKSAAIKAHLADVVYEPNALQAEVDAAVAGFDNDTEKGKFEMLALSKPDSEGWVTVTSSRRRAGPITLEKVGSAAAKKRRHKRAKGTEPIDFYRFQKLDAQKEKLALLRKQFDEDRHRMELLKGSRKFRPY
eukprot:m.360262 g.360262  ORF g.360262 m.360262 type:complete len:264 (-) comp18946_c0_seq1:219-1010(-)